MKKFWPFFFLSLMLSLFSTGVALLWRWWRRTGLFPRPCETLPLHNSPTAPTLTAGQQVKLLTYNVQYFAGKGHFFFYEGGADSHIAPETIAQSVREVARVIRAENPDIILLQEVNQNDQRTSLTDQLALLRAELPPEYACWTQTFYWRVGFVPHPQIWGPAGMSMVMLSKYRLHTAVRHALPTLPRPWYLRHFYFKRALLEVRVPVRHGRDLLVINTHLDVFDGDSEAAKIQVTAVQAHLEKLTKAGERWVLGGDFNLLPPGQRSLLPEKSQKFFSPYTELRPLFNRWHTAVPPMHHAPPHEHQKWCTLLPNDPSYTQPVCTLDHFFAAPDLPLRSSYVRQEDTLTASDHLPLITHVIA